MRFVGIPSFVAAFVFSLCFAGLIKETSLAAQQQDDANVRQESIEPLQVQAVDEIAAANVTEHHIHIHPQRAAAHIRFSPGEKELYRLHNAPESESGVTGFSVPSITAPGFYPADLSNHGGKVLTAARSHNIYVNCTNPATCWGSPATFLNNLAVSTFLHITDQYVGTTANNRYTVGTSSNTTAAINLTGTDILNIVHAAAQKFGSGYDPVYHIFLRSGMTVCTSPGVCYSPNNSSTWVFCAYHGSVTFPTIGHVLYTVEPYQNVQGCAVTQPSPNGALIDSTASTLSHELVETITDPDGNTWWAQKSLTEYGQEIGDICENPFGTYGAFLINGKSYAIQPEYANKYHACSVTP